MKKPKKSVKLFTVFLLLASLIIVASFAALNFSFFSSANGQNAGDTFDRDEAMSFLLSLLTNYNQDDWLCREFNESENYWVYNDNALAYQILTYEGNVTDNSTLLSTAEKIRQTIEDKYNFALEYGNDRIEVMFDQNISYPPYSSTGYSYSPVVDSDMQLGSNLVNNPSVEGGTTHPDLWYESSWANKTIWALDIGRTGSRSLELVANSSSDEWRSELFSVTPSENYLFNCYVNGAVRGGEWYLTLRWFNASQVTDENFISEINAPIGIGDYTNWTQIMGFNFTAPPNVVGADLLFRSINGAGTLCADDFGVNEITGPGSYIVRNDARQLQIPDWQNYSDLFVYGIVDEWLNNRRTEALSDFATLVNTICTPDGVKDSTWAQSGGEYQTYKTALVLICSEILNQSIPYNYTRILCQMQMPDGGFRTGYFSGSSGTIPNPNATENVETTCWAIYALNEPPQQRESWMPSPLYDVTISAHCNTDNGEVGVNIIMDGSSTGFLTSHIFTGLLGIHNFTVAAADPANHPFKEWSTGQTTTTITVSGFGTYTAIYEATSGSTGFPILWLIILGIVIAAVLTSVLAISSRRRRQKEKTP